MYFISGVGLRRSEDHVIPDVRCFGYFPSWLTTMKRVFTNTCDINEAGYYPWIIVEKIGPGIHPLVEREWWFAYDKKAGGYRRSEKPEWATHISNWAVG